MTGFPENRRAVLKSLGLHRLREIVYHEVNPVIGGMIYKVKEILSVELMTADTVAAQYHARNEPKKPAFTVLQQGTLAQSHHFDDMVNEGNKGTHEALVGGK